MVDDLLFDEAIELLKKRVSDGRIIELSPVHAAAVLDQFAAIGSAMRAYPDSNLVSLAFSLSGAAQTLETLDDMAQGDNYLKKCLADAVKKASK